MAMQQQDLAFIYVGTEDMSLPSKSFCVFHGGMDEVGLENSAIQFPQCSGYENIILSNFSVANALKYSFPICDCLPSKVYIIFKEVEKVYEFMNALSYDRKKWVRNMLE